MYFSKLRQIIKKPNFNIVLPEKLLQFLPNLFLLADYDIQLFCQPFSKPLQNKTQHCLLC